MTNLELIVSASPDGLKVVASMTDAGGGWPKLGEVIDHSDILRCTRLAALCGRAFSLTIIGDGVCPYAAAEAEQMGAQT